MQPRPNRISLIYPQIRRPDENAVFPKLGTSGWRCCFLAILCLRINGVVKRSHPPVRDRVPRLTRVVTDSWNDQKLACARGRHIGQTDTLGAIPRQLEFTTLQEIERRAPCERNRTQGRRGVDVAAGMRLAKLGRDVCEYDDRKLQALGLVN